VLAVENRARLDDTAFARRLTGDVEANAAAIDQLARASEEVRSFVTLVQKLARQSKLLALNAAMEAARAGDQGHGFAVVAEEVRRLAAMSSDAAERTERVVSGVLQGISESRTSSERTVETVRAVRGDVLVLRSAMEAGIADDERDLSGEILAVEIGIGRGLDDKRFARDGSGSSRSRLAPSRLPRRWRCASSEEQNASTEEIAAAVGTLGSSGAARRIVANRQTQKPRRKRGAASVAQPTRISRPVRIPPSTHPRVGPRRARWRRFRVPV
jgi:methyl-accepting chemotaxis protein